MTEMTTAFDGSLSRRNSPTLTYRCSARWMWNTRSESAFTKDHVGSSTETRKTAAPRNPMGRRPIAARTAAADRSSKKGIAGRKKRRNVQLSKTRYGKYSAATAMMNWNMNGEDFIRVRNGAKKASRITGDCASMSQIE